MALAANLSLTTLFGASAAKTGSGDSTVISFLPFETGTGGNVTGAATLSPEGIILGLIQKFNDAQGSAVTRRLEITRNLPVSVNRGGTECRGEVFTIRIFSETPVTPVDPDSV